MDIQLGDGATHNLPMGRMRYARNCVNVLGLGSSKSGDRFPKGAGVLSKCHEGDNAKSVFLRLGPSPGRYGEATSHYA